MDRSIIFYLDRIKTLYDTVTDFKTSFEFAGQVPAAGEQTGGQMNKGIVLLFIKVTNKNILLNNKKHCDTARLGKRNSTYRSGRTDGQK